MLFATAVALLMTTAASAQTIKVKVNVPFDFVVSRTTLPAGEYLVDSMDDHGTVLAIRSLNSDARNLVMSNSTISLEPASQTKIIFHRYGDRYFLYKIWVAGNTIGHQLRPSPREKEVAKDFSMQEVVLMAARH